MENTLASIDIGKAVVKKHEDGHLHITIREAQELDVDDIKALMQAKNQLCGDEPHTTLLVAGDYSSISKEARVFASSEEAYHGAIAKSIVTKSLPTRIMGNFFIRFNNPPAPTKVFACEIEALKWLNQMRKKALA